MSAVEDALRIKRLADERDQLLLLTQQQNQHLDAINRALAEANEERSRLARQLQQELEFAARVQHALLPRNDTAPYPTFGRNFPARQLSGDFYDFVGLETGMAVCLGDVSGKGANAALISAQIDGMFRALMQGANRLEETVNRINWELCNMQFGDLFITFVAGVYDDNTGRLTVVNAGHPPIVVLPDAGKPSLIYADFPPLGVERTWS